MKVESIENTGFNFYHFEPGERALVKRGRYSVSHRTPSWCHGYYCTVVRNNDCTVSVRIDGYEDEIHYIDSKDLVPLEYSMETLA